MQKGKLIRHLSTLSPREWARFGQFVRSPYHNLHGDTVALFAALEGLRPDFAVDDTALYGLVFSGATYDSGRLRVLKSYLLDLLLQFFAAEMLGQDGGLRERLALRALEGRQLLADEDRMAEAGVAAATLGPICSLAKVRAAYEWESIRLDVQLKTGNRQSAPNFQPVVAALDASYYAARLKYLCGQVNAGVEFVSTDVSQDARRTMAQATAGGFLDIPIVALYHHALALLLDLDAPAMYASARRLLAQHGAAIGAEDLVNLYGLLVNDCLRRYRAGAGDFMLEAFGLYKEMDGLDLIFGRGDFSAHTCKNIAVLGARVREYAWTRAFLERNRARLPVAAQHSLYPYCLAFLSFGEGNYGEAKRNLLHAELVDAQYRITHQALLLRIYYEMGEEEAFLSLAASLRQFLRRKSQLAEEARVATLNLVKYAALLMRCKMEGKRVGKAVVEELAGAGPVTDRGWLMEKVGELAANPIRS